MHALQEKRRTVTSLWVGSRAVFTQSFNPCSRPAILCCDSTEMANNFPFGRYSPDTIWVMLLRSEPPDNLDSLALLWGWKQPAAPIGVPTNIYQSQRERPRVVTTAQPQSIIKTNAEQTLAHSPTPTSASSPQPPLSEVPNITVAKKWLWYAYI